MASNIEVKALQSQLSSAENSYSNQAVVDNEIFSHEVIDSTLAEIFLPVETVFQPAQELFFSFEEALSHYLNLEVDSFLEALQNAGGKEFFEIGKGFLTEAFEDLFGIPVEVAQQNLDNSLTSGSHEILLVNRILNFPLAQTHWEQLLPIITQDKNDELTTQNTSLEKIILALASGAESQPTANNPENSNEQSINEQPNDITAYDSKDQLAFLNPFEKVLYNEEEEVEGIFLPFYNTLFPYDQFFVSFETAFLSYFDVSEEVFLDMLHQAKDSRELFGGPDFLNLAFEELFSVPVDVSGSNVVFSSHVSSYIAVNSLGSDLGIGSADFELDTLTNDNRVISIPTQIIIDSGGGINVSFPPPQTPFEAGKSPTAPDIEAGSNFFGYVFMNNDGALPWPPFFPAAPGVYAVGLNSEAVLNMYPTVELTGNIFADFGANFAFNSPANEINVFFDPARTDLSGASEDRSIPGQVTLTTAEGNTLLFYTHAIGGHAAGDFIYTLSNAIHTPPLDSSKDINGSVVFLDQFIYSLKGLVGNSVFVTNGELQIQIVDDIPQATDQVNPIAIEEANILLVGSNELLVTNYLTDSLIEDSVAALPGPQVNQFIGVLSDNRFGADGGSVTNVFLLGVNGTVGVNQQSIDFTMIGANMGFAAGNFGHNAIVVTDSLNNRFIVDSITGEYAYELNKAFTNTVPNGTVNLIYQYEFTDAEGQKAAATLTLSVQDDAPVAPVLALQAMNEADIANVGSNLLTTTALVDGELIAVGSGRYGADGADPLGGITQVNFSGAAGADNVMFNSKVDVITQAIVDMSATDGFTNANLGHKAYILTDTGNNQLIIDAITGQYLFTLESPLMNTGVGNTRSATLFFDYGLKDSDGSTASSSFSINILDDKPYAQLIDAGLIAEADIANGGSQLSTTTALLFGDLISAGKSGYGADGADPAGGINSITLAGVVGATNVAFNTAVGQITQAIIDMSAADGFTNANLNDKAYILTDASGNQLIVDAITGQYLFTLNGSLMHTGNDAIRDATLTFDYTLRDSDGSTASSSLTVTVRDDTPVALPVFSTTINEANIANIGTNLSTNTALIGGDLVPGTAGQSRYGADGGTIGAVDFVSASGVAGENFTTTIGVITAAMINLSTTDVFTDANENNKAFILTDTGGNQLIVDAITGEYIFTLSSALSHTGSGDTRLATLLFNYTLTDGDGSTASNTLSIGVQDDVPVAVNYAMSFNGPTATELTGDLVPAISNVIYSRFGADGGVISDVSIAGGMTSINSTTQVITVLSQSGNELVIDPTGTFTYTINNQYSNNAPITDAFTYTMTDNDGSIKTATLTFTGNPLVSPDYYLTNYSTPGGLQVPLNGSDTLIANDLAANGYSLLVSQIDGNNIAATTTGTTLNIVAGTTTIGTLTSFQDGSFTYVPTVNNAASFDYTADDQHGGFATSSAYISLIDNDTFTQVANDPVLKLFTTAGGSLLANDSPAPGVTFTVLGIQDEFGVYQPIVTRSGGITATVTSTGSFSYTDIDSLSGFNTEVFTYGISDNFGNVVTGTVTVVAPADPVVIDLAGDGIQFTAAGSSDATLGILQGDNNTLPIGWIGANDAILVYDPTGSGKITDINQVTFYSYAQGAKSEMEALRFFDSNGDNRLDSQDKSYTDFGLLTGDGIFKSLSSAGVEAITLSLDDNSASLNNGNTVHGLTSVEMQSGNIHIGAEVTFQIGQLDKGDVIFSEDVLREPDLEISTTTTNNATLSAYEEVTVVNTDGDQLNNVPSASDVHEMSEILNTQTHTPEMQV